jgi:pyridoxamine 5'-phosphate oxidase
MHVFQSSVVWEQLERACHDRQHGWRTPVLASTDPQGVPNARTIVLREADVSQQELVFFTDRRSPKVHELQMQPSAMLVFWCAQLQWQLRASVHMRIQTEGEPVDRAWERLQKSAPGSPLSIHTAVSTDTPSRTAHQLCILVARIAQLDWLMLSRQGNRRVLFTQNHAQELAP